MDKIQLEINVNSVYCGDALEVLRTFPSASIDLIVISPPYDGTRSYNGFKFDFEAIAIELARVLKPGGVIVWNVADATVDGSKTLTSCRQALFFNNVCGLRVHDVMFYEKNSCAFPSKRDGVRYSSVVEFVYIFSKGKPKTHNLICDKRNSCYGKKGFGKASSRNTNGELVKHDRKPTPEFSPRDNISRYYTGKGFSSKDPVSSQHPAIMPDLLAFDHIRTWSNEGDLVLDCFAGSGTTLCMAKALNRQYVGIEISAEYCALIEERLEFEYDVEELIKKSTEQYNSRFKVLKGE